MNQFPLLSAIGRGMLQLTAFPNVLLAILIVIELLPLLIGHPYLIFFLGLDSRQETFTDWLHPWSYSQVVILGFACVAMPGRWHIRFGLAVLAVTWIWGVYMTGIQSSFWPMSWFSPRVSGLTGQFFWLFAVSSLVASLVVSISGLELQWEPRRPRRTAPRPGQYSLGFLMSIMFALMLTMLAVRAFQETPVGWFKSVLLIDGWHLLQTAVWGLLGSLSMLAVVSSRWHWLWLIVIVTVGIIVAAALDGPGHSVPGSWRMPATIAVHSLFIGLLLPRLGVHLPRIARLNSLHRAMASVR